MKLLSKKQKLYFFKRNVKINNAYPFPSYGFDVYKSPSYTDKDTYLDLNPFTKSLAHELFLVKEKKNGFYRGNFNTYPIDNDMWVTEDVIETRDTIESILVFFGLIIPFIIYNIYQRIINKKIIQ
jgi:hypothetical protein